METGRLSIHDRISVGFAQGSWSLEVMEPVLPMTRASIEQRLQRSQVCYGGLFVNWNSIAQENSW